MALAIGDRISIRGGYYSAEWLGDRADVTGTVLRWISGDEGKTECVVLLDEPHEAEGDRRGQRVLVRGRFLVLHRRYVGQSWERSGTVHVVLCADDPTGSEHDPWEDGAWVESHAEYTKLYR